MFSADDGGTHANLRKRIGWNKEDPWVKNFFQERNAVLHHFHGNTPGNNRKKALLPGAAATLARCICDRILHSTHVLPGLEPKGAGRERERERERVCARGGGGSTILARHL